MDRNQALANAIDANERASSYAVNDQTYRAQVWSGIASTWAQIAAEAFDTALVDPLDGMNAEAPRGFSPVETHDEQTLFKVRRAIKQALPGLSDVWCNDIINEMQNSGILFRERGTIGP